jgi:hypothetical protein
MPPRPLYRNIPHHTNVTKPNKKWSHAELKVYVKRWKLDKAPVPLSGSKKTMVANLKREGHWDHTGSGRPGGAPAPARARAPVIRRGVRVRQKEEEVRPTERLEGPAAGSVRARVEGTHRGVLPFAGFSGFGQADAPRTEEEARQTRKALRQEVAAKSAAKRRKMKTAMRKQGLLGGGGGAAGPNSQMRSGGTQDGQVSHW